VEERSPQRHCPGVICSAARTEDPNAVASEARRVPEFLFKVAAWVQVVWKVDLSLLNLIT